MPNCTYCNKAFKDWQALGNHLKTHLNNSDDEDLSLPSNQSYHNTTTQIIHNSNMSTKTNVEIHVKQRSDVSQQEETTFIVDKAVYIDQDYFQCENDDDDDNI